MRKKMQSRGSSARLSGTIFRSQILTLLVSMFATFTSIYVTGRFFVFLTLAMVGSHVVALPVPPPQLYWNFVFPNTPMLKSLSQLVKPGRANSSAEIGR